MHTLVLFCVVLLVYSAFAVELVVDVSCGTDSCISTLSLLLIVTNQLVTQSMAKKTLLFSATLATPSLSKYKRQATLFTLRLVHIFLFLQYVKTARTTGTGDVWPQTLNNGVASGNLVLK